MAYNLSKHSVIRNRPQLDQLLAVVDDGASVRFTTISPSRLAYKIREALAAAEVHPEFEFYHTRLHAMYRFRLEPSGVLAEFQGAPEGEIVGEILGKKAPSHGRRSIPDAMEYLEVIGAAMKYLQAEELHFPNVTLPIPNRKALKEWAGENGWKYIDHEGAGITLTKKPVPDEVLWSEDHE